MLFVGAVGSFGVLFFTVIQPDKANLDALGYSVAALLAVGSLGYVASAIRLGRADEGVWRFAMASALLRVALSIFKVGYYGEGAAIPFLALDVWIAALLSRRTAFVRTPALRSSRETHLHIERRRVA
jgi:hypothetical protein